MANFVRKLNVHGSESTLLVLFIPSADRIGQELGEGVQDRWVRRALAVLAEHFTGATAFPRGLGVWRDDDRGGELVWDNPVMIQCYTSEEAIERHHTALRAFLLDLGRRLRQGEVGFIIDGTFYRIRFPLGRKG